MPAGLPRTFSWLPRDGNQELQVEEILGQRKTRHVRKASAQDQRS